MNTHLMKTTAAALVLLAGLAGVRADEAADTVKKQKELAKAHWKRLVGDEDVAQQETAHFLLYGPVPFTQKELKNVGTALEAQYALARKALQIEANDEPWSGKMAIYLFDDSRQFHSFIRTVARKRPNLDDDNMGYFSLRGDEPFLGAGPGKAKHDPTPQQQAGEQLAGALLSHKAGKDVPDWIVSGFGRATVWRATPASGATKEQRALARRLVIAGRRTAMDVWNGNLKADEAGILQGSLVEYLAYGPAKPFFTPLLEGYKAETRQKKTTADALKSARIDPDRLNKVWRVWVARH
ncbi:MAG TPA: hypothetical protein VG013_17005 [Gemmataceae bacterium]|jgi:hypothetical protein|nr:hypothetical protein [Gemmataceae bacterium]